jgi:hypothetical protein
VQTTAVREVRTVSDMSATENPSAASSSPELVEPGSGSAFLACPSCAYVTTVPTSRLHEDRGQDPHCEHTDGPPLFQGKRSRYATRMVRVTVHVLP